MTTYSSALKLTLGVLPLFLLLAASDVRGASANAAAVSVWNGGVVKLPPSWDAPPAKPMKPCVAQRYQELERRFSALQAQNDDADTLGRAWAREKEALVSARALEVGGCQP